MASRSPSSELADPEEYLAGWAALSELMDRGQSWSGHERNCVFQNRGGGKFSDRSMLSGLDFADDGRACVAMDFDGDGDLDLVFKNRSGPQLRFVRNDHAPGNSLMVRLRDDGGGNRDAIGARVEAVAGSRRIVRWVTAGDGYLGQASRWLHFGLAGVPPVEGLLVRWPDGTEEQVELPPSNGRVLVARGAGATALAAEAPRWPRFDTDALPPLPAAEAIVLREPLVLPPTLAVAAFRGQPERPLLLALWSRSSRQSTAQISAFATGHVAIERAGLDLLFLGIDEAEEHAKAALEFRALTGGAANMRQRPASSAMRQALSALLVALLGRDELMTPFALLVDKRAQVQIVYFGEIGLGELLADSLRFGHANMPGPQRVRREGRWAFAVERSLRPLIGALTERGLDRDAAFFAGLLKQRRESTRK